MKHFHKYTVPQCNCNYPFEDGDCLPARRRAEIKDNTEREARGRQSNEGARGGAGEKAAASENLTTKTMLVKC